MVGRLIDADSLKKNLSKWMEQVDPTHPSEIPPLDDMIVSTMMTVEEEPTVDAIPVEWIKNYINRTNDTAGYAVAEMLSDWEKECSDRK